MPIVCKTYQLFAESVISFVFIELMFECGKVNVNSMSMSITIALGYFIHLMVFLLLVVKLEINR